MTKAPLWHFRIVETTVNRWRGTRIGQSRDFPKYFSPQRKLFAMGYNPTSPLGRSGWSGLNGPPSELMKPVHARLQWPGRTGEYTRLPNDNVSFLIDNELLCRNGTLAERRQAYKSHLRSKEGRVFVGPALRQAG